jgi:predicted ATPase/DNA-binding XRE family transcriptional regulator
MPAILGFMSAGGDGRLGELLRDHRRAAGLTQEELAERAGLSVRSISDLERGGAHVPRRDTLALLVRALGLEGEARTELEASVERRRGPRAQPPTEDDESGVPGEERHNLPRRLTSFVGRDQELRELVNVLREVPLLTLVGAGGVGKTRLALELAGGELNRYSDGVWLVELAPLLDPLLVPLAMASALGLVEQLGRPPELALTTFLRPKQLLLVLDNCEHVLRLCAPVVHQLLRDCRRLRVLATSRERLALPGETIWRVAPLGQPRPVTHSSPEIAQTAAAQLFVDRARGVDYGFAVTDANCGAIARVCRSVEGVPLALELAAARLRAMSVSELADRLEGDFGLLASGGYTAQQHHRTLRATIEWSHRLLDAPERALFHRLAVFAGGWTLESAEAVASGKGLARAEVVDVLTRLVDKSMVVVETRTARTRYRFLEPIRQFALGQLELSTETRAWRDRHAREVVDLARRREPQLGGADEIAALDALELELDNIRAALHWSIERGDGAVALELCNSTWRFWERRGHQREGCMWFDRALAISAEVSSALRRTALNALSMLHWATGDAAGARPHAEEALARCRDANDVRGAAWALISLGMIAYYEADDSSALTRLDEALALARAAVDEPLLSLAQSCLARALLWAHGPTDPRVEPLLRESLTHARASGSRHATGQTLSALGELAWRRADAARAAAYWREALQLRFELRDRRGLCTSLQYLGFSAAGGGRHQRAAWLAGAAEAQRSAIGLELRHDEARLLAEMCATARGRLGASAFEHAWKHGHEARMGQAVRVALGESDPG